MYAKHLMLSLAALLLVGCDPGSDEVGEAWDDLPAEQQDAPNNPDAEAFTLPVIDAAGLKELQQQTAEEGKVLVIDFWATWCGSCVQMFPKLHEEMKERGDKVRIISISHDENAEGGEDYIAKAARFITKRQATHGAYLCDPASKDAIGEMLSDEWDGVSLPAIFVFGKDGDLAYEMLETEGDVDEWVAGIAAAVDKVAGK